MKKMILLVAIVILASHALAYDWYFDDSGPIGKGPNNSGGIETANVGTFGILQDYTDDIYLYYSKNGVKTLFLTIKVMSFSHKDTPLGKQNISLIFEKANFFRESSNNFASKNSDQKEIFGFQPYPDDAVRFDIKTDSFDYSLDDVLYITWKGNMAKIKEAFEKPASTTVSQLPQETNEIEVFVRVALSNNKTIKAATNTPQKLETELKKFVVTNVTSSDNKFPLNKKKEFITGTVQNKTGTFLQLLLEKNSAYELKYGNEQYPYLIVIDEIGQVSSLPIAQKK